jgi:hypothetical protein
MQQENVIGRLGGKDEIRLFYAEIIETLKKVEDAGFDEVILYFNVGLKPHPQVKDEMARFMAEVALAFT